MKRRANKWINYFRLCLLVFLFLCFYNQLATEIFANESFYRDMEQLEASNYNGDGIPTSFYIREGANGTNDGSDWANAWNVLPETLERGAIYYVASGTYSTYIFDDEEVNEEIITIRKATVNDHGTDEGWNNSYASGQALFTAEEGPIFRFITGYYTIDGQTGEGKSGHGIRVYNPLNDNGTVFHGTDISRNLTFEHLEIEGGNWREDETPTTRLMYLTGDLSHMTMRSCYVHEASMQWLYMCRSTDVLIEDSYFENCKRGMGLKIFGSSDQMNVVIRNNTFGNVFNTNNYIQLGEHHQPKSSGYKIYGNVFFMDDPSAKCTFAISNCSHSANDDVLIYNNTFVGVRGSGLNFDNENDTIVASNNLWVDCNPSFGNIKDKNNSKGEFGRDIFINAEEKDFRLRVPLGGAIYLGSEYELDPDGKERGLDGSRDYGAYEFLPDDLSRPIIARQPETMSVKEGDIVTFSVIASSLPAPDYQWQLNGQDIEGEITTTLTLENVQPEDSGYYTVLVSNSEGVTISDSALLIITDEDPQHILQIDFEGNLSNSIDINFRTEWNGTECYMGGINGLAMDTGTTDGNFVKIHNGSLLGGMDELTLTIRARKNILETGGTLIYKDTQYGLSISGNEISGFLTDDRWITFGTSHNLDNINDYEWHHYALVYDGENIIIYVDGQAVGAPQYFPGPVLSNSNPIIIGSDLRGDYFNGQLDEFRIYRRALTEEEIKSLSDVRTYDKSPSIIKQPTEKSAGMGEHVTFSVIASGYSTPTYQWQKNGQDIPGESGASLTITDLQSGDSGDYRVVVSNSEGTVTSNSARLTVISKPPGITSFNSIGEYYTSYLYWENPGDEESWDRIAIMRNKDSEITNHNDGEIIYEGTGISFIDKGLTDGTYYYAAYTSKNNGTSESYSDLETTRVDIPETYNKNYLKKEADQQNEITIGQNTRGDLYTLWNTESNMLGKGPGGNETDLWVYSDLIGNGQDQIPVGSEIVSAKLVFNVEDSSFVFNCPHSIKVYQITDPDNLGLPHFADESGLRVGLDFNYRDHRPGINIPWLTSDGDEQNREINILSLFEDVDPVDIVEFYPEVYEDGLEDILQLDITEAVQAWVDGDINQGLFIRTAQNWQNGEQLQLYGLGVDIDKEQNGNQTYKPYIEVIYSDTDSANLTAPEPVSDVSIEPDIESITLNWTYPDISQSINSDIAGVKIMRRERIVPFDEQDGELAAIIDDINSSSETFTDTGLTTGKTYYYSIYTYDNEHNYSDKVWIKAAPGSPGKVERLMEPVINSGSVTLNWDSVTETVVYRVYRKGSVEKSKLIAEIAADLTSYTDYLPIGVYTYWITAVNEKAEGPLSEEIVIEIDDNNAAVSIPSAPSNLEGTVLSYNEIELRWNDVSTNESGFVIRRQKNNGEWKDIAVIAYDRNHYIDSGLQRNILYNYRIYSVNSAGESEDYSECQLITEVDGPGNISWEVISANQIKVEWEDILDENGYRAELLDIEGSEEVVDSQIIYTRYCYFTALEPGKEYQVRVSSIDNENSIKSDIIRTYVDSKGGLF